MPNGTHDLKGLSIIIPVYNEDHGTIMSVVAPLKGLGAEVIVVDDGSEIPIPDSVIHEKNRGYGAALMTGIKAASNPVVMTMDGDGQHSVLDVLNLWTIWKMINVEMVIGRRKLVSEVWYRYWGRKFLNIIASLITLYWIPDLNSGMRIFKRQLAINYFPIICERFSFTTSITISFMCDGYRIEWFPINVGERVYGRSRVRVVKDGLITLYYILRIGFALRTREIRAWLRRLRSM